MKKIIITVITLALLVPAYSAQATTKSLNTKNNKNSCKFIKTKYEADVMLNWSNGTANDQDVLKEIDLNIKMLTTKQKSTSGKIKTSVGSWISAEKNTKTAIFDKNIEAINAVMELKIKAVTEFDKLCNSIK